jgi:hypothetical protein
VNSMELKARVFCPRISSLVFFFLLIQSSFFLSFSELYSELHGISPTRSKLREKCIIMCPVLMILLFRDLVIINSVVGGVEDVCFYHSC